MRLFELISFLPKTTTKSFKDRLKKVKQVPNTHPMGRGHFGSAFVHDSPKRKGQVIKYAKAGSVDSVQRSTGGEQTIKNDGYMTYIKMVIDFEEGGGHNPYFPRIDELIPFKGPDGNEYYKIALQKLYPIDNPKISGNEDLMLSIAEHMFDFEPGTEPVKMTGYEISKILMYAADGEYPNISGLKDPQLMDAMTMIDGLVRTTPQKFHWDLGSGNVMWRITGTMPQLVFTDPIA